MPKNKKSATALEKFATKFRNKAVKAATGGSYETLRARQQEQAVAKAKAEFIRRREEYGVWGDHEAAFAEAYARNPEAFGGGAAGLAEQGAMDTVDVLADTGDGSFSSKLRDAARNATITNGFQAGATEGMQYRDYTGALDQSEAAALAGMNANGEVRGQQQSLATALAAQARGEGPNPAQEQLKRNLNLANQQAAGMISSQKGINPALAARIAAQGQGAMSQNASSQAAELQAQQQLGAQGQLGQVLGQMGGQNLQQAQLNMGLYGQTGQTQDSQNTTKARDAQAAQAINAGISQNNVNATQATNAGLQEGIAAGKVKDVESRWSGGEIGSPMLPGVKAAPAADLTGQGATAAIEVEKAKDAKTQQQATSTGAGIGGSLGAVIGSIIPGIGTAIGGALGTALGTLGGYVAGQVQTNAAGGLVPGRAAVQGDSPKNDTVPALLSPGEIVIPRTKATPNKAREFVKAIQEQEEPDEEELRRHMQLLAQNRKRKS